MFISDLRGIPGRRYPARRWTRNMVGGAAPIQAANFAVGYVVLEPRGGQVPWHNQEQEEVYFVLEGTGEMCLCSERRTVTGGQAAYIPSGVFHQLTNTGDTPLTMAMRYEHFRLGKMISSPEEFAIAVKAPKESFGEAQRSASAPSEIEELLRKIREAEAEGRPSEDLHKQLLAAVNAFRRNAMAVRNANSRQAMPLPYQPKSIVITAKRGNPAAERAQVVASQPPKKAQAKAAGGKGLPSITITPVNEQRQVQAQIAETMRQIRLAEAQGQPADDLRRKLSELVDSMK